MLPHSPGGTSPITPQAIIPRFTGQKGAEGAMAFLVDSYERALQAEKYGPKVRQGASGHTPEASRVGDLLSL